MSQYISINFNLAGGTRPVAVALWRAYKIISQSLLTNRCTTTHQQRLFYFLSPLFSNFSLWSFAWRQAT
jgi:hypothetical protein